MDEKLQDCNGILDPESSEQPTDDITGKIVEFFHYKVVEKGCDPGEVVNIRSALASVYKRKFLRLGEWKVLENGQTQGTPTNSIVVNEAAQFYKREKKTKGYTRSLPFRLQYMSGVHNYCKGIDNKIFSSYLMAACSLCFSLWLRIDEMVKLTISSVRVCERNEDGVPHHLIFFKDRKYARNSDGQSYAIYRDEDDCACSFTHLTNWIDTYRSMLSRQFLPEDPLFPRFDEDITKCSFGEHMNPQTFMKTVNKTVRVCGIIPKSAVGMDMGKLTAH